MADGDDVLELGFEDAVGGERVSDVCGFVDLWDLWEMLGCRSKTSRGSGRDMRNWWWWWWWGGGCKHSVKFKSLPVEVLARANGNKSI